jgi:hypothetical protein
MPSVTIGCVVATSPGSLRGRVAALARWLRSRSLAPPSGGGFRVSGGSPGTLPHHANRDTGKVC